jgi:hypothetical protein
VEEVVERMGWEKGFRGGSVTGESSVIGDGEENQQHDQQNKRGFFFSTSIHPVLACFSNWP